MSKEVVTSTNEQKNSMAQTQSTIDRLSEMAQEISQSNRPHHGFFKNHS